MKKIVLLFLLALMPTYNAQAIHWQHVLTGGVLVSAAYVFYKIVKKTLQDDQEQFARFQRLANSTHHDVVISESDHVRPVAVESTPEVVVPEPKDTESVRASTVIPNFDLQIVWNNIVQIPVLMQNNQKPFEQESDARTNDILKDGTFLWKNIRQDEAENCAYHAFKNIERLLQHFELLSSDSRDLRTLSETDFLNHVIGQCRSFSTTALVQMSSVKMYIKKYLAPLSKIILKERLQAIATRLNMERLTEQEQRVNIKSFIVANNKPKLLFKNPDLEGYNIANINCNNGYIKTSNLASDEVENLLKEIPALKQNTVVLEYQNGSGVMGSLMMNNTQDRIDQFKRSNQDIMGIVWNEQNLKHWIGYVAIKHKENVVLFEMNSSQNPRHVAQQSQYLLNFLKS